MDNILNEMLSLSGLELIAALLAFAYVWLAAKQHILCWPCAFISSGIYVWIFLQAELPYQGILNLYYVLMAIYGWVAWNKIRTSEFESPVKTLAIKWHVVALTMLGIMSFLLVKASISLQSNLVTAYLDVGIAVFSVFTTFLVTQKYVENWGYWIVINSAAAYLYFTQELYFTTILFGVYIVMSIYGLKSWRESLHSAKNANPAI